MSILVRIVKTKKQSKIVHKTLVAGFVGIGLLAGCLSAPNGQASISGPEQRAFCKGLADDLKLSGEKWKNRYSRCMSTMAQSHVRTQSASQSAANNQISGEAWMRMGSAMTCQSRGGIPNYSTGDCTLPQQRRVGNVYDNSNRLIGTYVEN